MSKTDSETKKSSPPSKPPTENAASAKAAPSDLGNSLTFIEKNAAILVVMGSLCAATYFLLAERPALSALILAAVALLATVFALWNSVRALAGDGELPPEFDDARFETMTSRQQLLDRKQSVLRALKDLENERDIGKITDEDFADVASRYREEAKALLRELDTVSDEQRRKAEALAKKHLRAKGLLPKEDEDGIASAEGESESEKDTAPPPAAPKSTGLPNVPSAAVDGGEDDAGERTMVARHICPACAASNEFDAKFCKACAKPLNVEEAR
ncbi:MAG: hypothetical protein U0174_07740 [Polyangiaceae bacterium]